MMDDLRAKIPEATILYNKHNILALVLFSNPHQT
jgi:hypothetical protein